MRTTTSNSSVVTNNLKINVPLKQALKSTERLQSHELETDEDDSLERNVAMSSPIKSGEYRKTIKVCFLFKLHSTKFTTIRHWWRLERLLENNGLRLIDFLTVPPTTMHGLRSLYQPSSILYFLATNRGSRVKWSLLHSSKMFGTTRMATFYHSIFKNLRFHSNWYVNNLFSAKCSLFLLGCPETLSISQ